MLEVGTVVAERFKLVRPLGEGAMGSVWLAQHTQLDVPCAVKFILGEGASSADLRARFEREAKAAAGLRSPHVVGILDHGVWAGTPYIAMEYLEGEDLAARLQRLGRLAPRDVVDVVVQVARALAKAHAAGLVHRDLKPANIFLARDDDREIAKVLDFGIAKQSAGGIKDAGTKTGALMGTPYYMSPEQVQGTRALDHRSDLWSLGVVVFQCLTGLLPFVSEALGDLMMKIMVNPAPIPSQLAVVPPGFDAWWARAAARDPAARFQGAKEMAEALALALGVSMSGVGVGATSTGVVSAHGGPVGRPHPSTGTLGMPSSVPGLLSSPSAETMAAPALAASPFAAAGGQPSPGPAPGAWSGSLAATAGTVLHMRDAGAPFSQSPKRGSRAPIAVVLVGALLACIVALVVWARPSAVAEAPAPSVSAERAVASGPREPAPSVEVSAPAPTASAAAADEAPSATASSSAASPPAPDAASARPARFPPYAPAKQPPPNPPKSKDLVRW